MLLSPHISPSSSSPIPVPMSISLFCMFSQFFEVPFTLNSQSWAPQVALAVKNTPVNEGNARDMGLIPGSGRSHGEGHSKPLQYSYLKNPMDRGAWWAAVHGVAKSWTGLSDFTFTFHFHALEKEMATHSSVLVWRIPGTGEPDGLPSMGSHRVGHG